jgi:hypothetical protein
MSKKKFNQIVIPIHPDDANVPISTVHIKLSKGRYATIQGPLGYKTVSALLGTLEACKDVLTAKPAPDDFEI